MNILVVTQSPDIIGGANRSLLDVIDALTKRYNHNCIVLSPGEGQFAEAVRSKGIICIVSKYQQTQFVEIKDWKYPLRYFLFVKSIIFNRRHIKSAISKLNKYRFDIVYINDTTNTFGFDLSNHLGVPFIWHFRGYQKVIKRYLFNEKSLRNTAFGKVITISNAMQNYMHNYRKLPLELMEVVHNGVVNKSIGLVTKRVSRQSGQPLHCVHCGHISEAKGMSDSVQAIGILKQRGYSNIYLHIAGTPAIENGEFYDSFLRREYIEEFKINEQVIFEGEVSDMVSFRNTMHIELMCSKAEPFGRTTVEGLQSGLVVIGANTGATPEIITDKQNGLLYEQGNPIDLANKIELIYNNIDLEDKLSNNALEFSKNHFTMEENVSRINDILENVVKMNKQ